MSQKIPTLENLLPGKIVTPDAIVQDINRKLSMVASDVQQGVSLLMNVPVKIVAEIGVTVQTIIPEP